MGQKLFRADLCINGLVKLDLVATVTVGNMAALSHLTDRDMGNVYDVGNILDHVNAAFTLPCAADVIVEPKGILLIK